jgi:hypothetical protein
MGILALMAAFIASCLVTLQGCASASQPKQIEVEPEKHQKTEPSRRPQDDPDHPDYNAERDCRNTCM